MDTLKIRITPLLKTLGFCPTEGNLYELRDADGVLRFRARIGKSSDHARVLDIEKLVYHNGVWHHNELLVKQLAIDPPRSPDMVTVYEAIVADWARELEAYANHERLAERLGFYLGLTDVAPWDTSGKHATR